MQPLFEYELVTPPAALPVTLAEAKQSCRVDHDADDGEINMLISAATSFLDAPFGYLGRAIVAQSWRVRAAGATGVIELPFGAVSAVTAIQTHDGATLNDHDVSDYWINLSEFRATIEPKSGNWPAFGDRFDALQISFDAGVAVASVRDEIKLAVLFCVRNWYEEGGIGPIPQGVFHLLENLRRYG